MSASRRALLLLAPLAFGLVIATRPASAQRFRRPVACDGCIYHWFYKDQGELRDWNCGNSTYSGHLGSDYSLSGDNGAIDAGHAVVAMAAGTVVSSQDGFYDHCLQCGGANCGYDFGNGFGNHVIIDHGAYTVIYGHMRFASIRVTAGAQVTCGQTIGEIGSSGCSTGAHLHIEPQAGGAAQSTDPYAGDCSPTPSSLWVQQNAYHAMPSPLCDGDPLPPCPAGTSATWTCNAAHTERRRCEAGNDMREPCAYGCMDTPAGADSVCMPPPDADGDSSRADVDCNDANPAIHPGAVDVCGDGIDQDCSGRDRRCPQPADSGSGGASGAADGGSGAGGMDAAGSSSAGGAGGGGEGGSSEAGRSGQAGGLAQAGDGAPITAGQGGAAGTEVATSAGSSGLDAGIDVAPRSRAHAAGCAASPPASRSGAALPPGCLLALLIARRRRVP